METARGVMAVWHDLEPGHERAFEAWYQRQHVPERLQVPGFIEARRYVAGEGSPRYCAFYWLDSVDVLRSPAYLQRLAEPTAWTRRTMRWFRAMARTPCTVALDRGSGVGGAMTWVGMMHPASAGPPMPALRHQFDEAFESAAFVRMQLWQCAVHLLDLDNPEQRLRADRDQVAAWIVFVEATTVQAAEAHSSTMFGTIARLLGSSGLIRGPVYRLLSCFRAEEAPPPCADDALGVPEGD